MTELHKCIFCLDVSSNFNTIEHIVPESLGNDEDILENAVCNKCQNYFGKEIESYILAKTPFGLWRTFAGTRTKKGKQPFFDPSQSIASKGRLNDYHDSTDSNIAFHPDSIEINDKNMMQQIISGEKTNFKLVLTPKMLIYIGRFLGKIALEYWFDSFGENVFDAQFNDLRNYVRRGTINSIWPIMQGKLAENLLNWKMVSEFEEKRVLYSYSFFQDQENGAILFNFDIGLNRYGILLNHKFPDDNIFTEYLISAAERGLSGFPQMLWYHPEELRD